MNLHSIKGVGDMGSNVSSSIVNKHVLVEVLDLRQFSNTTIFIKGNIFVLSPSIQNTNSWFDLRKVNLDRFDENHNQGFLILRYFVKILYTNLKEVKTKMMPEDKTVFTQNIGTHWKFNVLNQGGGYAVFNQQSHNFRYPVFEVTSEELKDIIFP